MNFIPLLASLLLAGAPADSVRPWLNTPLGTRATAQGAAVIVHRQPALPVVSLRMSLLGDDPPGYAGAGHLLQHLALPALQERVNRVGGRVEIERNADAVVYTVTGPAGELPFLAETLRSTLEPSAPSQMALLIARSALEEERHGEWETARGHVRAALRKRLFPEDISAAGTEPAAERLTSEVLPEVWARMYRPARIIIVAVGDVTAAAVEAQFARLPAARAADGLAAGADTVPLKPLALPQATDAAMGVAYSASDLEPAAVSVVAELLRRSLRGRVPAATVEVEHWWTHYGQSLVVMASAPPRSLTATRRGVGTAVSDLSKSLEPEQVRDAVNTIRRNLLFFGRTPENMAKTIGQFADRSGNLDAAQDYYAALDAVDAASIRRLLGELADRTPVRVDVAAQVLPKSK